MGDLQAISKARKELEELYSGIPDESVNLTFQDFAEVRPQINNNVVSAEKKNNNPKKEEASVSVSPLTKLPSLDFNRGLKASSTHDHYHHDDYQNHHQHNVLPHRYNHHHHPHHQPVHAYDNHVRNHVKMDNHRGGGLMDGGSTGGYDDVSGMSMVSNMSGFSEVNGMGRMRRRRPGIPHSNICTVCSTYIYIFRHRCLVCGRVYCRQCVGIGMGDMAEGRKCIECLGKRFSQRYIQTAGEVGCCMGYPSTVKQQELKWAEKGPKRTGEDRYGRSGMVTMSRSRSPNPKPPPPHINNNNNSNSFVMMNSPYFSPTNHPLPF